MKNRLLFLLAILVAFNLSAQKQIDTQFNSWWMYFGNHRLSDDWGLHTEYQWRRNNGLASWQQSLMRVGVDRHLTDGAMLSGGYGWIESYPYGEQPIASPFTEHRIWQQLILKNRIGRFYMHHRYRLEQRFLENVGAGENEAQYRFRQRARYRAMVSVPLSRKAMEDNTLFLALYDEVFLGFGKGIGKNILDQNRLYAALGWRFTNRVSLQLGYLNHMVIKSDGIRMERNHTLQTALTWNLDFRKD